MEQQSSDLDKIRKGIEHLLRLNRHFVLFKHPNESEIFSFIADDKGDKTYVFQPFHGNELRLNGFLLAAEDWSSYPLPNESLELSSTTTQTASLYMNQTDFESYVDFIRKCISRGEITKCVAARLIKAAKPDDFNAFNTFVKMCSKYPKAYCYLAQTPVGMWMGATPELLLKTNGNKAYTMSLAGTKSSTDISPWTDKEYEEQSIVTEYIKNQLARENIPLIKLSEVCEVKAGHLKHLKTDIQFEASPKALKALHPTPAVCGIPMATAQQIIKDKENNQRALYAGYLGLEESDSSYYVNLRCMRIAKKHIDIFVGAGITKDSNPYSEWQETAAKAETMKNILN